MGTSIQTLSRKPSECSENQIHAFAALVRAGDEIDVAGLCRRIRAAERLVFLMVDDQLCGSASLKRPLPRYRERVASQSGQPLPQSTFPFEIGWVFVTPAARGRKLSVELTRCALEAAGANGVFATSRTDNAAMHATLRRFGFDPAGLPWQSSRGHYDLRVFLKKPPKQVHG